MRTGCGLSGVLVAAAALLLSGCSVIDSHKRVEGWPELKIVEHHVSTREMRDRCTKYVGPLMSPEGCTVFYLDRAEAHIYVSQDFPSAYVLEHERLHAAGYDHIGSEHMARVLENWKKRVEARREQQALN
jgi:quinol monooxygenase YgiN